MARRLFRPRLLPAVIAAAILLLGVKIDDLWADLNEAATAQTPPPSDTPAAQPAAPTPAAAPMAPVAPVPVAPRPVSSGIIDPLGGSNGARVPGYTAAEVSILQELSQRRADLDKRDEDVGHRELMLQALENQVNDKIATLTKLQDEIKVLADEIDQQQQQRLNSLVHIYESMKPADAAQILQQMDMPVLLQILTHMKDQKTAPILAAMDPAKARAITIAMADKVPLPDGVKAVTGQTN